MDPSELLARHFGFGEFRPGQRAVIDALLAGHSALAVFPTGGGKSLCYQLPALALEGVTLVVSPLIALMKDQIDFLQGRGIAAARLDSSLSLPETQGVMDRLRAGALKLLYVAPERFNNERFLSQLKRLPISLFAIDEAHCISEWGHNFRPDYLKLAAVARDLRVERVLALTATATPAVVEDIRAAFDIAEERAVVTGFYRPNLELHISAVTADERDALLLRRVQARPPGSAVVYVTLQKTAMRVAEDLGRAGLAVRPYHAGMESEQRGEIQDWWAGSSTGIVVATIAFGMGIDKADVRYVYHYNLPKSLESYSQEIGRAGRDGAPSIVELLACGEDAPVLENFAYGDTPTESAVHGLLAELFTGETELLLNLYDLSARHDLRPLVLRTALTYLELNGTLRQGTPCYVGYEIRPLIPLEEIGAQFQGEPARFVAELFAHARKGRTWYALDPDAAAVALDAERRRVVRALEYLAEHGWAELRTADLRHRYTVAREDPDPEALTAELMQRFAEREEREITRVRGVLDWVELDECQVNALARYFGEERAEPCGHCAFCRAGRPQRVPPPPPLPPLPGDLDTGGWRSLREAHPAVLGEPRQAARFLCGLSSPAVTRARLGRHALFGALAERRFGEVLKWCAEGQAAGGA